VWLGIGCTDCGDAPLLTFSAIDPLTQQPFPGTYESQIVLDLSDQSWPQSAGIFVYMPGAPWDETSKLPVGTRVKLTAKLTDQAATTTFHEGSVEVVLGEDVNWDPCDTDPNECGRGGGTG
jgi:hypothetical protein